MVVPPLEVLYWLVQLTANACPAPPASKATEATIAKPKFLALMR
jgi:hypothetical protein